MNKSTKSLIATGLSVATVCLALTINVFTVEAYAMSEAENEKNKILKNYPPDFSEKQEINVVIREKDGIIDEIKVRPDVHYRGADGKEYLVFYNDNVYQLQKALESKLKNSMKDNALSLAPINQKLIYLAFYDDPIAKAEVNPKSVNPLKNIYLNPVTYPFISFFTDDKTKLDAGNNALSLHRIKKNLDKYGSKLKSNGNIFSVVIDKDLKDVAKINHHKDFDIIERTLFNIMNTKCSHKNKIEKLDKMLDKYLAEINPEASLDNTIRFCYPINRISFYLAQFEKGRIYENIETLKAMSALRKKIDRLTITHRYIFERDKAPILDIPIDRCKIVANDSKKTEIYLDRAEVPKFISNIYSKLENKAYNYAKETPGLEPLPLGVLAEYAGAIAKTNVETNQQILDALEKEKVELENQQLETKANMAMHALKSGAKMMIDKAKDITEPILNFAAKSIAEDDPKKEPFTKGEVEEYVNCVKSESTNSTEKNENSKCVALPLGLKLSSATPEEKSNFMQAFEDFLNYCKQEVNLKIKHSSYELFKKCKEDNEDFLNLFKSYIYLRRGNFENRYNFDGIIFTEDRHIENADGRGRAYREYFVREIKRLDDEL